jgi:predicted nucleic acid-binding Zn ribbon protein
VGAWGCGVEPMTKCCYCTYPLPADAVVCPGLCIAFVSRQYVIDLRACGVALYES